MGGICNSKPHWFGFFSTKYLSFSWSILIKILIILFAFFYSANLQSAPQTPSQALPKMFQKPTGLDYYEFKKQEQVIPNLPTIDIKQQEDTGIKIIPETIIILAPKELQNIIEVGKYQKGIVGEPQSINKLYSLALDIEKEFNDKGYRLLELYYLFKNLIKSKQQFFQGYQWFYRKIDLSKVPKTNLRTYAYLKPLINKKSLRLKDMERQLLLASNIAGMKLSSSLASGFKEGGTKLIIEAEHKAVSGGLNFDNTQSKELGRQQGQARAVINSPLGLGETISLFGLSRPTFKGMSGTGIEVPIRAGGVSISAPVGDKGVTAGVSYLESMTRPGGDVCILEANMKSAATISYLYYIKETLHFLREHH